jgi:hypothetical protein
VYTASDILKEAIELKARKEADYQGSKFTVDDYFPFDDLSYIHMLWIKMLRIRNVVESGGEVNFESAEDSLIDLINYSAMYAAHIKNRKRSSDV